jgi:hypothetical protein
MKLASLLALLAVASCTDGGAQSAHVVLQVLPGWTGTSELMVHTPGGALVSRAPITADRDVAVTAGDTVSLVHRDGAYVEVDSLLDVDAGDTLHFMAGPLAPPQGASVEVTLPVVPGATGWWVGVPDQAAIESTTSPVPITVPAGAAESPILAEASGPNGTLDVYGSAAAPIVGGGIHLTTQLPFQETTITPTHPTMANTGSFASTFVGYHVIDIVPTTTYAVPTGFGDKVELGAFEGTGVYRLAAATFDPVHVPTTYSPDLALHDLPTVAPISIRGATVTWRDDAGTGYDVVDGALGFSNLATFTWSFAARPGSGAATMPALPADLGAPATFDSGYVVAYERSTIDGYEAMIATDRVTKPGDTWGEIYVESLASSSSRER